MEKNIGYYRVLQNAPAYEDPASATIRIKQAETVDRMRNSVDHYPSAIYPVCTRNGVEQELVLVKGDTKVRSTILAMPGDELCAGDIVECMGKTWLIREVSETNPIQRVGTGWICNYTLRWQNNSEKIHETPCVLDRGVYSATQSGDYTIHFTSINFKLYLPYNDDTKKLYVDKRIALDRSYDRYGNEILEVYRITGKYSKSRIFGTDAHLMICELKADLYAPGKDNIDELVCDYFDETSTSGVSERASGLNVRIRGASRLQYGTSQRYSAEFTDKNGNATTATPVYTVTTESGVTYTVDDDEIILTAEDSLSAIGATARITAADNSGSCEAVLEVEVTG